MATLDMRPSRETTDDNEEEVLDTNEEEKPDEAEAKDGEVEDDQVESSATEEPSEKEEVISEDTEEKTVTDSPAESTGVLENKRINALSLEEKRLRDSIVELRKERRSVKEEKVIIDKVETLEGVNPDDVALIEKVIRAKGFVRKDEISAMSHQEKLENYKDAWLQAHPEYLPENDPDDVKWSALKSHVDAYFKAPSNPKEIEKILDLAHLMVSPKRSLSVKEPASAQSAKEKLKSSSAAAGGGQTKSTVTQKSSKASIDPGLLQHLQGFSEEELKDFIN